MKYISILIIVTVLSCNGVKKNDLRINQFDENNFKHGNWIEYLKVDYSDDKFSYCNEVLNLIEISENEAINDLEYEKYRIREINYSHGYPTGIVKEYLWDYKKNNKQTRTSQPKKYLFRTFSLISGPYTKNYLDRPDDKFIGLMKIYFKYNLERDVNEFGGWIYFDKNGNISPEIKILSGLKDLLNDTSINISKIDDADKYEKISNKYKNNPSDLKRDLKVVYKFLKNFYDYNPDKIDCIFESSFEAEIINTILDQELINDLRSRDKPKEPNATRACEWCGKPNNRIGLYYEYKYCSEECRVAHKNSKGWD